MIKKLCTLLLLTCITAAPSLAQRYSSSDDASFAPKKGQWQVSVLLGSGKFFNENTSYLLPKFTNTEGVVGLPNGGTDNSGNLNRYLNIGSLNNNSLVNIAGIEGKYFLSDNWDLNFQFSMNISLTPKKDYVEGDNSVPDMFKCINQRSWSPNNAINSLFIAFLLFRVTTYLGSTALDGELADGTGQLAVLAECKGVGDHFPGTTQQTGYFTHLSVFYHYSFFHNSLIS